MGLNHQTIPAFLPKSQAAPAAKSAKLLSRPIPPAQAGKMSNVGTSKGILEIAKFGIYVTIPMVLMYIFANNSKNIQRFMGNRSYVVYPPEAPRPPSPEEMWEMARELARKNNVR